MDRVTYSVTINGLTEATFDTLRDAQRWAFRAANPCDAVLVYRCYEGQKPDCIGDYSDCWKRAS